MENDSRLPSRITGKGEIVYDDPDGIGFTVILPAREIFTKVDAAKAKTVNDNAAKPNQCPPLVETKTKPTQGIRLAAPQLTFTQMLANLISGRDPYPGRPRAGKKSKKTNKVMIGRGKVDSRQSIGKSAKAKKA